MSSAAGHNTVTDGLVLCLDATDIKSYSGSGTTWYDRSTNGNNGILTNGPIYSSADGGSIAFDGSNDYVSSNVGTILDIGTSVSITYSAWIKYSTSASNYTGIIAKAVAASGGNTGFQMLLYANKLSCEVALAGSILVGPLTGLLGTTLLNTGKWFNIVLTINRSTNTVSIYVNGVLESSQTNAAISTYNLTSTSNLLIATERTSALFLNGNISQALIYNKALSQAEVLQNYNAQKARYQAIAAQFSPLQLSPALWLDASDATTLYDATVGGNFVAADGTVARWEDKSGNARHATQTTLANRPLRKTAIQNGKDAVRFDGSNDWMLNSEFVGTSNITIFAVVKANSKPCVFIDSNSAVQHALYRGGNTDLNDKFAFGAGGVSTEASISDSINVVLLTVIRNSNISTIRKNGIDGLSANVGTNILSGYRIGDIRAQVVNGYQLNGDIFEILIFPTALSNAERQSVETYLNTKWSVY